MHESSVCYQRWVIASIVVVFIILISLQAAAIDKTENSKVPLMFDNKPYSSSEVRSKLNAFFVQYKKAELQQKEIPSKQKQKNSQNYIVGHGTLEFDVSAKEHIYRIFLNTVPDTSEKLNEFIACSMGLMSIFTPEMNAKVRGEVLSRMMGLKRLDDGRVFIFALNWRLSNIRVSWGYQLI